MLMVFVGKYKILNIFRVYNGTQKEPSVEIIHLPSGWVHTLFTKEDKSTDKNI